MAGQGKKTFSDGEVLSAADVNGYLMDQSVMRFADSSARTAAIGTPTEGMVTYLDDVNQIEVYDGTAWVDQQAPILSEGTAGQYLQSNGTAGSQWVDAEFVADIITTQGDLVIGDASGNPVRLPVGTVDQVLTSDGTTVSFQNAGGGGFSTITEVTASDSSYDVSGITGFARITLIGGGGQGRKGNPSSTGDGGDTSITISGTTTTAKGGAGGELGMTPTPQYAYGSFNGGSGQNSGTTDYNTQDGSDGNGGEIVIFYANLTGVSSVDIVIGAGGSGSNIGNDGFRGIAILESA